MNISRITSLKIFSRSDKYIDKTHTAFGGHNTLLAVMPIDTTNSHTGLPLAMLDFSCLSMLNKYMGIRQIKMTKIGLHTHGKNNFSTILYNITDHNHN
jgi:hypothetical protein